MYDLIERARRRRGRLGFTLVELLVVIVVLAVLAAMVLPKFMNSSRRSKESALMSDLQLVRNAISLYQADCGCYPAQLSDLAATTAPASGLNPDASTATITASAWNGPYLQSVPSDPITGSANWKYGTTVAVGVGSVASVATGNGLNGTAYTTW